MMQGLMPAISGMRIVQSVNAVSRKQIKFPRSNKKRMQKKWTKNNKNYDIRPAIFMVSGNIIAHPAMVSELTRRVAVIRM